MQVLSLLIMGMMTPTVLPLLTMRMMIPIGTQMTVPTTVLLIAQGLIGDREAALRGGMVLLAAPLYQQAMRMTLQLVASLLPQLGISGLAGFLISMLFAGVLALSPLFPLGSLPTRAVKRLPASILLRATCCGAVRSLVQVVFSTSGPVGFALLAQLFALVLDG